MYDQGGFILYWAPSQYKDRLSQVYNFHVKNKMAGSPSYLYHGDLYTGNMTSLSWDAPWSLTSRLKQTGRHFADDIFKHISLTKNTWISLTISLQFVPKRPTNNIPAWVQMMAWGRPGNNPSINQRWLVYRRMYPLLGLIELILCFISDSVPKGWGFFIFV